MAHKLEFSIEVNNPDGTEFYAESHRIYPDDQMLQWFMGELADYAAAAQKERHGNEDNAKLSAVLELSVDGVATPPVHVDGVSYHGLMRLERKWHQQQDKLLKIGEQRLKHKKKK